MISGLENDRVRMEREKEEIAMLKAQAEETARKLAEKQEKLDAAREKMLQEAKEKAADVLREAKEYADRAIRNINKSGAHTREMEEERSALRERYEEYRAAGGIKRREPKKESAHELQVGDEVLVLSLNLNGTLLSLPNTRGEVNVQLGAMRTTVKVSDVEFVKAKEEPKQTQRSMAASIGYAKSMTVSPELNIVGKRVDEALPEVDKYLDDAYLAHIEKVNIIHGRGTGALRDAVHAKLKRTPYVKSFRLGEFGEGDRGVTIVEFKK